MSGIHGDQERMLVHHMARPQKYAFMLGRKLQVASQRRLGQLLDGQSCRRRPPYSLKRADGSSLCSLISVLLLWGKLCVAAKEVELATEPAVLKPVFDH
jgi:hypothetical protein